MLTDGLVEFWTLNNSLTGINGNTLVSGDGLDHYVDPGKIGQGWDVANDVNRRLMVNTPWTTTQVFSFSVWLQLTTRLNSIATGIQVEFLDGSIWALSFEGLTFFNRVNAKSFVKGPSGQLVVASTLNASNAVGTWYHAVLTWDGSVLQCYFQGQKYTTTGSPGSLPETTPLVTIGARSSQFPCPGVIDSIGYWDEALSDAQVAELYNSGNGWEYVPPDNTPDAFTFTPVADADPSTVYESNSQAITGMDAGTAISITGGEYRLDGGAWTSDAGTIDPGQTLELRATSSSESEGVVTVSATVGTVTVDWTITTAVISSIISHIIGNPMIGTKILESRIVQGWI